MPKAASSAELTTLSSPYPQSLAAELAPLSDDDLMRRLGCSDLAARANKAAVTYATHPAALNFNVRVRLLLCPEECLSASRTSCECPVIDLTGVGRGATGHAATRVKAAAKLELPAAADSRIATPGALMRSLPPLKRHGVASSQLNMTWSTPLLGQRFRLRLFGTAPAFWAEALHFYSDAGCTEPLFPEDARDSGHEGCCSTGCVKGIEVGACCCERMHRAKPCEAGECWVEADFGASVEVACMEYLVSGGDDKEGLRLELWQNDEAESATRMVAEVHQGWREPQVLKSSGRLQLQWRECQRP